MKTTIHSGPAYRLALQLTPTAYGTDLKLISYVPTARRPGEQVRFQMLLTSEELNIFAAAIQKVLPKAVASATI